MNTRFLRDEAARFRGMAEEADREATKERFLAMAAGYEARAGIADGLMKPNSANVANEVGEPDQDEPVSSKADRKVSREPAETASSERRPDGRIRLSLTAKRGVSSGTNKEQETSC